MQQFQKKCLLLLLLPILAVAASMPKVALPGTQKMVVVDGTTIPAALPKLGNVKHRWRASSLSSSPVELWQDEKNGFVLSHTAGAAPLWSTNGVLFYGTNVLHATNSIWLADADGTEQTNTFLIVLKHDSTAAHQMVICQDYSGGAIYLGLDQINKYYNVNGDRLNGGGTYLWEFVCFAKSIVSSSSVTNSVWTNSAPSPLTLWNGGPGMSLPHWGTAANHANGFQGLIKEMVYWTNTVWTTNDVMSLHNYVTNTYGKVGP